MKHVIRWIPELLIWAYTLGMASVALGILYIVLERAFYE